MKIKKLAPLGADRASMLDRKKKNQPKFKVQSGVYVNKPRAGESGTYNTGNVARKFIQNAEKVINITGVDQTQIQRCGTTLSCGRNVDYEAFGAYCDQTAR